jgi:hypothetical protein
MAYHGINFRASSGYVTDGTGETYSLSEAYPTTRSGKTFGFDVDINANSRDRSNGIDRRLAGGAQKNNSAGLFKFYFDLPEGAGTYDVRLALGDNDNAQTHRCVIRDGDGGAALATINAGTGTAEWLDATGVLRTSAANWASNNAAAQLAFTGTQMVLDLGNHAGGTNATFIAHVSLEFVSGGGGGSVGAGLMSSPLLNSRLLRGLVR